MSLGDPLYFLFLGATFLLYYMLRPGAPRRILLLAASYFFYFELATVYLAVLLFVTFVTYRGAQWMRAAEAGPNGSRRFWLAIVLAVSPLLLVKYVVALLPLATRTDFLLLALPIGISFFTFAALGYLIDVHLEVVEPEPDFCRFALFLGFFPIVSSGPIERAGSLLPQFDLTNNFSAERALAALRLIFVGLILKLYFASYLEVPADGVFAVPANYPPISRLTGVIFYAFSLYADFAGYTLIAIGSARLLGLEVRPNFQQPFLSTSVPEFWRNWHISLSSWVRDYLFSPLRMEWRRRPNLGMAAALMLSFIILGVWHGAKWGFLIFGAMHGLLVTASTFTRARRDAFWKAVRLPPPLLRFQRTVITFGLVLIPFVVFRAKSLGVAMILYHGIFSLELLRNLRQTAASCFFHAPWLDYRLPNPHMCWGLVALLIAGDILVRNKITLEVLPRFLQGALYYLGIIIILNQWISANGLAPFQYYKF